MVPNGVLVNHTVINQKTMDFLNYVPQEPVVLVVGKIL